MSAQRIDASQVRIQIIKGNVAPKYANGDELVCVSVNITEEGTEGRLPLVDFEMRDDVGNSYLLVLTGRIVNGISAAVKGCNLRNHGTPEP